MKIAFAGGGTGGHFYPLIAVAEAINNLSRTEKLVAPRLFYLADRPYDPETLFENRIEFQKIPSGKLRRYFSWRNFWDAWLTGWGIIIAFWKLYWLYPDIIFSKGGYTSFPVLVAARLLNIPIVIHESDSRPGRVNLWASRFAVRVAVSYSEAAKFFPKDKTAVTGNPIRQALLYPISRGAYEFLKLQPDLPVIFVAGGSQGAAVINETVLDILTPLVERFQIIHQTGDDHLTAVETRARYLLANSQFSQRYHAFPYLKTSALQMIAGVAALIVSRAGSFIFEIAHWGIPAIIIPIPEAISHDQRSNAFAYAKTGAAIVIAQNNLTPSILLSEINRLLTNPALSQPMKEAAKNFAKADAAELIAKEIMTIALRHENSTS